MPEPGPPSDGGEPMGVGRRVTPAAERRAMQVVRGCAVYRRADQA